jgi:hypothetical protein
MITALLVAGLAIFIKPDVISDVSKSISIESEKIISSMNSFKKDDALLWDLFIDEPSTRNEVINNIKILDKSVPLYHYKDSITLSAFNSIYTIISNAENKSPIEMKNYPLKSDLILSLQESYINLSTNTYNKFTTLKNYYNALLSDEGDIDALWNQCEDAQNKLENSQSTYVSLMNEFLEFQKKRYNN